MENKIITKENFLMMCNIIASKHNCTINIDFENKIVDFDCSNGDELKCAFDIDEIFSQYKFIE